MNMMHLYQQQQQQKQQNRLNMRHTLLLLILFAALIAAQQTEGGDNGTITAGSSTASFDSKEPIVKDDDFDSDSQSEQLKLQLQYGTEVSWPMQRFVSDDDSRSTTTQKWYTNYLQGCYETYSVEQCNENERDRIALNAAQPGRQKNFTFAGYAKVDAPREAFLLLQNFWNDHSKNRDSLMLEEWDEANIYTNHWEAPTSLLSLNPPSSANDEKGRRPKTTRPRPRLAEVHRRKIVAQVQSVLEQWTSVPLQPTSLYGIRSYTNGSILAPHVDRVPLVISAIINVAQDVDEDWILEVISHDGIAVNITMEPGSMVLYESHSILHGRPYPLKGRFFANCFLHFEPIGYSSELKHRMEKTQSTRDKYETAFAQQQQQHQQNSQQKTRHNDRRLVHRTLPSFIQERTVEASRWRQEFVFFRVEIAQPWTKPKTPGANNAHMSAARDDVDRMREIASTDPASLLAADINGWTPFHEAARGGNVNAMLYLLHEHNVDVNERTNKGRGGSPLWWAEQELPDGHLALDVLRQHGAVAIPPERKLLSK